MTAAIIVALITALAAIIAPIITQLLARNGAYKLKELELFFLEKVKVYNEFINLSSTFPQNGSTEEAFKLVAAINRATLFSSEKTSRILSAYYAFLTGIAAHSQEDIAGARTAAISAMQEELRKYQK